MKKRLTRDESRDQTRQSVMDAAEALFVKKGYRGASLDEIADTAGYSKGAVYSNFSSKGELFVALLDRRAAREAVTASAPQGATEPDSEQGFGWPLATLDFFVEAVRDPVLREALAARYSEARARAGAGMAGGRPDPAWATWPEIAAVAMALGSGLIIQQAIDDDAIASDLMGRVMERLVGADAEGHQPQGV